MHVITDLGYEATLVTDDSLGTGMDERARERRFWALKFTLACIFSIPVFLLAMVFAYIPGTKQGLDSHVGGFTWGGLSKWILTTPVQVALAGSLIILSQSQLLHAVIATGSWP